MQQIVIERTAHIPQIECNQNGRFKLEGRALPEDANRLFAPVIEFANNLTVSDAIVDINLEYFNTATSKKLLELMKNMEANVNIGGITINWHYEEGDDDSLEMAEIYEECLVRTKFNHFEFEEVLVGK